MNINTAMTYNTQYVYQQPKSYVDVIYTNVSNDATFDNLNALFEKLSLKLKRQTVKEEIFDLYSDCVYFGEEENRKLNKYINENKMEVKNNIFDYYD